jgi:hypothetical protein
VIDPHDRLETFFIFDDLIHSFRHLSGARNSREVTNLNHSSLRENYGSPLMASYI